MGSIKISALPTAAAPAGADLLPLVQGGATKKTTKTSFLGVIPVSSGGTGLTVVDGSYVPTLYNLNNVSSSVLHAAYWFRVGDSVHVWGQCDVATITAAATTQLGFSLPVFLASFNAGSAGGVLAFPNLGNIAGAFYADAGNHIAVAQWIGPTPAGNQYAVFAFTYKM